MALWDDVTFGLLLGVFVVCGLVLLTLCAFASWKLCWVPYLRNKEAAALSSSSAALNPACGPPDDCPPFHLHLHPPHPLHHHQRKFLPSPNQQKSPVTMATDKVKDPMGSMGFLEAAVKISHTHSSFKRHLPRQMQSISLDLGNDYADEDEQPTSIGRIKPELYRQKTLDTDESAKNSNAKNCGKINFSLKYDYENEALLVNILKAFDLPAKDLCGSSDPYVKIYLLPDRKKFQTRVHRKTLNPTFDESFQFPVPYDELAVRKLHMSVFDFDRFSRHDMIGEVVVDNLVETSDLSRETDIWRDIQYATTESVDLGEIMFSLCYLPTAGRLTLTVIKCRNLKAMDITGYSDPYVKVSLVCDGRRLKKKKTTIKKNTLNPTYNEAIIFDIPPDSMDHVSLHISVMDYDFVGHNEIIGVNRVGCSAEGLGKGHWNEMLAYPRKPIAHWHPLLEAKKSEKEWKTRTASLDSQGSCPSPRPPSSP
ncbi:unnamed protein product [Coregonus sp. 'balchen']|nr:unnamed protein product [Coregonus sp. 'balchen']